MWDILEKIIIVVTIIGYCVAIVKLTPKLLRLLRSKLPLSRQQRTSPSNIRYYAYMFCFYIFIGTIWAIIPFFFFDVFSGRDIFADPIILILILTWALASIWMAIDGKLDKHKESHK